MLCTHNAGCMGMVAVGSPAGTRVSVNLPSGSARGESSEHVL